MAHAVILILVFAGTFIKDGLHSAVMLLICPKLGPPKFMSLVTNHRIALFRPVVLQLLYPHAA